MTSAMLEYWADKAEWQRTHSESQGAHGCSWKINDMDPLG
jgi:hypothetical protein